MTPSIASHAGGNDLLYNQSMQLQIYSGEKCVSMAPSLMGDIVFIQVLKVLQDIRKRLSRLR